MIQKSKTEKWIAPRREHRMITADGQVIQVESAGVPIQSKGRILHFGIFSDIGERKRSEEELRIDDHRMEALLQLNQMTHASLQEIASFAMEEAVRLTQSRIGYLAFANEDESVLTMYAWSRSAMKECAIEQKPIVYPVADTGLWGEPVRQRKAIITNDYRAPNPLKKGFPKGHVNVERHLGVPIFDNDRIVIVAGVGDKGSDYNERDIKQLELLMSGMWRIVQRKQAEDALRHSEARFRTAFENASVGITLVSLDGIYLEVNEAFARILGYSPEDLIGKSVGDFTHPNDLDRRSSFLSDLISGRIFSGEQERRLIHRNGSVVWTLIGASVQRDQDGRPMYFISLVQDITERKTADEKLRETEKKYRELAESLPQVIFEVDLNGTLKYVNQAGHQLFGYTQEEIANGFNVMDVFIPEDRERLAVNIMRNTQGQMLGRQDYTAVRKDGTKFPVGAHASPVMSGQTATGIRGILIDLTTSQQAKEEKKKLEIQLQQAQKMEAIGALAGGIAHDFNNILSAIIGYTELAMLNEGAEHCTSELNEALKAANRAKDLVKQILAFSRQTDEDRMPVRVALVAKEAVKFIRATIPTTIEIKTCIDEKSGAVLANSVELHQIIMNLCTNAHHAIGEQTGLLEVTVQNTEIDLSQKNDLIDLGVGSYVRISVKDTGYGMTTDVIHKIFDPYFTTKEKGVGTGLGLAVVHGIVKKYEGTIKVESEPGKGTTFHIYLPKVDIASPNNTEQPKALMKGSERILFVDDEIMLVDIGQQILKRLGYEVVSRTSPLEALELFKAKPDHFDLVITDKTMPGMTGDALAKELLSIRPNLPVILCTGYSQIIDQKRAKQLGIRAFVMKPILINEISAAIRKALSKD
jgi:PAS domain S-box-containing protein